jgi:hypothetical protein
MTTIRGNVCSASRAAAAPSTGGAAGAASPPAGSNVTDLLPACDDPNEAQLSDALSTMFALQLQTQGADEIAGKAQIQADQQRVHDALQEQLQALERQLHDRGGRGFSRVPGSSSKTSPSTRRSSTSRSSSPTFGPTAPLATIRSFGPTSRSGRRSSPRSPLSPRPS